jgi:hypothetical protein
MAYKELLRALCKPHGLEREVAIIFVPININEKIL